MFSDKFKNQTCTFSEETISYLYGEFEPGERAKIETHVSACAECAAEAASFAVLRSSISDWKIAEFDHLKTPLIRITPAKVPERVKISLVEILRAYFPFSPWATATASLVLLSIFSASALFFYNRADDHPLAGDFNRNSGIAVSSPAEIPDSNLAAPNTGENRKTTEIIKNKEVASNTFEDKKKIEVSTLSKTSKAKKNSDSVANKRNTETENNLVLPKAQRQNKIALREIKKPTLADSTDADEDKSLRLADIFEEISRR